MEMSLDIRKECINRAVDAGLKGITEVGKKRPDEKIAWQETHRMIEHDIELGAQLVIIEAREGVKASVCLTKPGLWTRKRSMRLLQG
jgi:phosphosulfolactate synthase (CoM biosynthesis protein A)